MKMGSGEETGQSQVGRLVACSTQEAPPRKVQAGPVPGHTGAQGPRVGNPASRGPALPSVQAKDTWDLPGSKEQAKQREGESSCEQRELVREAETWSWTQS